MTGMVMPAFAILLGMLFDTFTNFGSTTISSLQLTEETAKDCKALLGLGIGSLILNGMYLALWVIFGELQAKNIRSRLFSELLDRDLEWFDMQRGGIGALISRLQIQIREVQVATSQSFGFALQHLVRILAALALAFYTSWNLTLVAFATVPFFLVVVALLSSRIQSAIEAQKSELNNASSLAHEAICAIDTVKCFNGQSSRFQKYVASVSQAACHYMRQAHLNSARIGCARLMMFGIFIQGFWYGSSLVGSGAASAGDVMRTFWACIVAMQSIEQLLPRFFELEKGKVAASSLKVILYRPNPDRQLTGSMGIMPPRRCHGKIEVKSVSFAYPSQPNRLVLQCASFIFPAGNTIFIIGRSGSGKSTLADLLLRFYAPISGEILIDDKPIQTFDVRWIRNNITLVQQESILFNETILQNIVLGGQTSKDARPECIKPCIEMANLQDLADTMPDGFNTVVGAGGNLLSGGQRQRVAIARARLRDTPILILDECTSALDSKNRTAVMKSIRVAIGDAAAAYWMHYLLEYCGQAWTDSLRGAAMVRILDQPRSWFELDENMSHLLVLYLDQNAEEMRKLIGKFAAYVLVATSIILIAFSWSFTISWKLTIVGLACGPLIFAITRGFEVVSGKWEKRSNGIYEKTISIFSETFLGIRTVKALTLESYFDEKHFRALEKGMKLCLKRASFTGFFFGLTESAVIFVTALLFFYGAVLESSLELTANDIIIVFSMLLLSMGYVNVVLTWIPEISLSRDNASRLLRLSNLPLNTSHEHVGKRRDFDPTPIRIQRLNFRYPHRPEACVLRDVSLTIPMNSCIAIVGHSGSGKSTLASLLLKLYPSPMCQPGFHTITLGGIGIRHLHTPTLRSLVTLVPQQPKLLADSIGANIGYGLPSSSPLNTLDNIRGAAQAAGIDEFISSLPNGYETVLGDGGICLSGGQAQQVAIARSLIRQPQILILDEVTASLDGESADTIKCTIRRLVAAERGLAVIIITHAREMMEIAENVIVMDHGSVVEEGPYNVLLQKPGGKLRHMLTADDTIRGR
ncbi:hypothetical protein Egran_00736 [Elaphomyces granulatus]|uniref:Uncharacterized protein n=1 Tax=Elaphomyces granulatus TaxID=519963 RepID=A0A232M522_9EURO|nr:hypothetical protein Egran_00736 [Elaphomyces granulatus]